MAGRDGSIYVIRNLINGKCYVGQTTNSVRRRIQEHLLEQEMLIGSALRKYQLPAFSVSIFRVPLSMLDEMERELIARLGSVAPLGYNVMLGGQRRRVFSVETRERMRKAQLGKRHSAETRLKMSLAARGVPKTPQHIMAAALGQRGKMISIEQRQKIRESLLGRKQDDERRAAHRLIMQRWWDERKKGAELRLEIR